MNADCFLFMLLGFSSFLCFRKGVEQAFRPAVGPVKLRASAPEVYFVRDSRLKI